MNLKDLSLEEKLTRFLYINHYHGIYITGNPDKHLEKWDQTHIFKAAKTSPEEFVNIISKVNEDTLLPRRANLFYVLAAALNDKECELPDSLKLEIRNLVLKLIKNDEEFYQFIRYFTLKRMAKQKVSTTLRKLIIKFYQEKKPLEFAKLVTKQDSYHGWSHKDLLKLSHFKCENIASDPVLKYALFGTKKLPETVDNDSKIVIDLLRKSHELRTTEDVAKAVELIRELHASSVDQVNSKLNKNEQIWLALVPEMSARDILKCLHRFHKLGFLKQGNPLQSKIIEAITNPEKVKQCNLHPVEVFINLKFFEKGGKVMDPKLLEYLQKKNITEDKLKKLTTPSEPKCKAIIQNINKCLNLSYNNIQPTGKKIMITIDVTENPETKCFHNKRITCYEAIHTLVRFLIKIERSVTVAVFKDSQINFVDLSKSHSVIDTLQEYKASYILPTAPIDWARNKKKVFDVFIHFMTEDWSSKVPAEVKEKIEKMPECLNKYCKKMKIESRLVKIFLAGNVGTIDGAAKNILFISGFSVEVPKVLEAFCRGHFC